MTNFQDLSKIDQENFLMSKIIKALRKLGGKSFTKELSDEVVDATEEIPEEYAKLLITSKKGNEYHPFAYTFNFAVKYLLLAGFLKRPIRGTVELTEKGRTCLLDEFDPDEQVRKFANPHWRRPRKRDLTDPKSGVDGADSDDEDNQVNNWKDQLAIALSNFTPAKFELFARALVKNMGVTLDESIGVSLTGDGGLDGFGYLTTDDFRTARVAIQAKRWQGLVSSPEIDKFRGAMDKYNAEYGVFITTSDFTRDAIKASRVGTRVITLINGDKIADLVAKYHIYAHPVTTYVLEDYYNNEQ
jgi:restriction system protein